jgi:predicted phosphodiesterase
VLSDIHFPFARVDLIDSILEQESDSDIVVVNGDLLEGYAASTFEKSKRIAALDEYRLAFGFIKKLSENFPQVVLVEGNHDTRTSKHLSSFQIPKEITQVLRPNLMARIANGEELDSTGMLIRRHDFDNVYYDQRESWYVKIGKTLFIHPHNFGSSKPGWTVMKAYTDFFSKRYQPDEFDSIVCGHTHKIYKGVENSVLLIEQGCLVGLLGYSWSPKMKYTTNSQNGYAVIYQDAEGNTDFNLSGPIFLGESFPKKKDII